jgi:hypothetical protein
MNKDRLSAVAAVVLVVATVVAGQVPNQRLTVTEKDGAYEVTLAVSRLVLRVQKDQLVPSKPGTSSDSPGYFSFEDRQKALVVSGWFEPEQAFKGVEAFWSAEQKSLDQAGIRTEDVVREQIGNWQVVFYDIRLPGGRSSNMRAECVQSGTWIDLHISVTANQSEAEGRKRLRAVLGSIQVGEKAG